MPETEAEANLRRQLEQTLAADPSSPLHHYKLGVFLWGRAEAEQEGDGDEARRLRAAAAEHFLAAAKLNPNDGVPFRFLGHHYARGGDTQRATKCYQRAVALSPDDAEAGEALCDLLDVEGKESLELAVCKEAAGSSEEMVRCHTKPAACHTRLPNLCGFMGGTWSGIPPFGHVHCSSKVIWTSY
ncbi:unnamed protein product [Urochloa humidicola]